MIFSRQKTAYQSELDQLFNELKKRDPSLTIKQEEGISFPGEKMSLDMNKERVRNNQFFSQANNQLTHGK